MQKITLKIEGMACGMCEAHMNDAVRAAFKVKKITSSHAKGETVIIIEDDIDNSKLHEVVNATGYKLLGIEKEPYEKKGFLSFFKR